MAGPAKRTKHLPLRRCLACRSSRPQADLVRLVVREGQFLLDASRKAVGRGAWLCRDRPECLGPKRLKRSLRAQAERVAEEIQAHLKSTAVTSAKITPAKAKRRVRVTPTAAKNGGPSV